VRSAHGILNGEEVPPLGRARSAQPTTEAPTVLMSGMSLWAHCLEPPLEASIHDFCGRTPWRVYSFTRTPLLIRKPLGIYVPT